MPAKRSVRRIRPPRIRNITAIRGPIRSRTLIHFSKEQWEQAIAEIPRGKAIPKHGICLECYPIPGGDVVAQPNCIQNPCEICRVRTRFSRTGEMTFDCLCRPDPRCPSDPVPPIQSNLCALGIERRPVIRIVCRSQGCNRTCRLTSARQNGRILILCRCS